MALYVIPGVERRFFERQMKEMAVLMNGAAAMLRSIVGGTKKTDRAKRGQSRLLKELTCGRCVRGFAVFYRSAWYLWQ